MNEITAKAIEQARSHNLIGRAAMVFERVSSTNDVALAQSAGGAPEGLLVLAEEQSAGRGRLGRSWYAPVGSGLLFSLLFRPCLPVRLAGQVTMCVGLGAAEGIEAVTGLRTTLKWPNDLLLDGLKLGGMLAELEVKGERLSTVVVGLGLNVNLDMRAVREPWAASATSLRMATGKLLDRRSLLLSILERTEYWYACLSQPESERSADSVVFRAWSSRLDTLGRPVEVALPTGRLRGIAVSATSEGALQLRTTGGELLTIWSGDVQNLRTVSG